MPNGKVNQEHRITKLEEFKKITQADIAEIKNCVNNHIPTAIKDQGDKFSSAINQFHEKFDTINTRFDSSKNWLVGILCSTILLLIGVIINFFR